MSADRAEPDGRYASSGEPRARQLAHGLLPYLLPGEVVAVVIVDRCTGADPQAPGCDCEGVDWRLGLAVVDAPAVDPFEVAAALARAAEVVHTEAVAEVAQHN